MAYDRRELKLRKVTYADEGHASLAACPAQEGYDCYTWMDQMELLDRILDGIIILQVNNQKNQVWKWPDTVAHLLLGASRWRKSRVGSL